VQLRFNGSREPDKGIIEVDGLNRRSLDADDVFCTRVEIGDARADAHHELVDLRLHLGMGSRYRDERKPDY
jgi:hypothetical protein